MSALPDGWALVKLNDVGQWGSGGTPTRTNLSYYSAGTIPWLVIGDLNDGYVRRATTNINEEGLNNSSAKLLPVGTVLIAMYGSIGKLGITDIECATNQAIAFCKPNLHVISVRYLFYTLFWAKPALLNLGQGGAQQNISQGVLRDFQIPLAPHAEQTRIADQLDKLLARIQGCNARLDTIPVLLKRLRQAVLAAATSGRLTDNDDLGATWGETTIGSIAVDLRYGSSKKCEYTSIGTGVLRIPNIADHGRIDIDDLKRAEFDSKEKDKLALREGDLLVIRSNGSVELVGKTSLVTTTEAGLLFAGYLMRLRVDQSRALPAFIQLCLSAPAQRGYIERTAKSTSGVNNLNAEELRAMVLRVPSLAEQAEIVRRVEALFKLTDSIEVRYSATRNQVQRVTPLLLAKAFRGELVTQDPNDETASELLKRIVKTGDAKAVTRKKTQKKKVGFMNKKVVLPVVDVLRAAKRPLTASELLLEAGYPVDANTELVERFFLDLREEVKNLKIERVRQGVDDVFSLVK